jgi:hypothetical protein
VRRIEPHAGLLVFALGLVVIATAAALAIDGKSLRLTGYNDAPLQIDVATVPGGARACQPGAAPWEGTEAVRLGGRVEGPAAASVRAERQGPAEQRVVGPWTGVQPGTDVVLPLPRSSETADTDVTLCVSNRGPAALVLSGVAVGPEARVTVYATHGDRALGAGRFRVEGLASDRPVSGWGIADRVPERIATGTGAGFAPWLAIGGLIVAIVAGAALLSRTEEACDAG